MQVVLYNNSSDSKRVHKSLTTVKTITECKITDITPLESLTLELDMFSGFEGVNYVYIASYGRYYYAKPEVINGNIIVYRCDVDVLMSHYGKFQNSKCIAKRSSNKYNPYLVDDCLPFAPTSTFIRRKTTAKFTPSSSGGCYILTVGGK